MDLSEKAPEIEAAGVRVVGITYDSPDQLWEFSARYDITFLLLSDTGSAVIRQLGILNTDIPEDLKYHGVPYPGIYLLGADRTVTAKFAEEDYRDRPLLDDVIEAVYAMVEKQP